MERIALNPIQYKFWADDLLKYPALEYNDTNCTFQIVGNLSISVLEASYRQIMNEYSLFHSIIEVVDSQPFFQIDDTFDVPLVLLEKSPFLSDEEVKQEIEKLVYQPFNLQKEYPCRFYIIRLGEKIFLLHVFHHIVMDGLTFHSFCERLSVIYNQIAAGNPVIAVNQMEDVKTFNSEIQESFDTNKSKDLKYWFDYLSEASVSLPIPQISKEKNERGGCFDFMLGHAIYEQCNDYCNQRRYTPFQLFSVVWSVTLAKTLGESQFVMDHTVHMLPKKYASLLGVFVNNLPVKYVINDNDSIEDLLNEVNKNRYKEYRHLHIVYSDIIHALVKGKKTDKNVNFFNVGINYPIRFRLLELNFVGCSSTPFYYCNVPISNDLLLEIDDDKDLSCRIRYSREVAPDLAESLAETFEYILNQVLEKIDIKVGELGLVPLAKQNALLAKENDSLHLVKEKRLFLDWFRLSVEKYADKIAAVYCTETITYADLDLKSQQVAKTLLCEVGHHKHIGLSMPKSIEMLIGILGILKSGNVYVPIDYNYPQSRIDFILSDCNLDLMLVSKDTPIHFALKELYVEDLTIDRNIDASLPTLSPDDVAYIIYTSGSTGLPKGTPIKHYSLDVTAWSNADIYRIDENTRMLQFSSICFDVSIIEIFPAFYVCATLIIPTEATRKDINLLIELLKREKVTFAFIPPAIASVMPHVDLPDLATMMVAGEPTNPLAIKYWSKDRYFLNVYGPTESCGDSSVAVLTPESFSNDIGRSMSGVTYYVLDKNLTLMPDYTIGELYIGGYKLTDGYVNRPELNNEKFIVNPFVSVEDQNAGINTRLYKSGDLVFRQKNGHLIFIGRTDYQVKLHGYRIELGDVETKVMEYGHGIKNSIALVHEHGEMSQLVVYVQTETEDLDLNTLRDFLKGQLPEYMLPSMIIPLTEFPYNTSGKVDRKRLPSPTFVQKSDKQEPPVTETEVNLAEIWSVLLENSIINRRDSFISLGGDSMSIIMLSFRIQEKIGISMKASDIYSHITLAALADFIDNHKKKEEDAEIMHPMPFTKNPPLAPTQLSLWIQCVQSETIKKAYNLPCIFKCPASISENLFIEVFNSLVKVQDSFRMTFPLGESGTPYIQVSDYAPVHVDVVSVDEVDYQECLKSDMAVSFDLEKGPLFHCTLYHLPNGEFVCSLIMHHLISDGWSVNLIRQSLLGAVSNDNEDVRVPSVSYLSYASENNLFQQSEAFKQRIDYWKEYLQGISGLKLPLRNSSDELKFEGGSYILAVPSSITDKVVAYCRTYSYTPFLFHCATFLMLLSRVNHQTNFAIGFPFLGREKEIYNQIIGYFVHTLPICFKEGYKDLTFAEYLSSIHTDLVSAEERAISLKDIQNTLRTTPKGGADTSLIQVMFAYEEDTMIYDCLTQEKSTFPLSMTMLENEKHQCRCYWEYSNSYFNENEIRQIADAYLSLLMEVVDDFGKHLNSYPISSKEYRDSVIASNSIVGKISFDQMLFMDKFHELAVEYPQHTAIIYDDTKISYQELDSQSSRLAHRLRTLQLPDKSRIGIIMASSIDCILAILGTVKAGFSYVPIDIDLPIERKKNIISDAGCVLLWVEDEFVPFSDITIPSYTVGEMLYAKQPISDDSFVCIDSEKDELYVIYTSGTTGLPKGIPITHGALATLIKSEQVLFNLSMQSRVLQFAGISFDASVTEIFTTLFSGGTLVIANYEQRHDPNLLLCLLESQSITCATIPPALLPLLSHKELPLLETMIVGGESTAKSAIDWWSKGRRFINAYGPTENTVDASICIVDDKFEANDIGTSLPGVSCYILDEHLNILPPEMPGELYIGGLQLTQGYINRPKLNREKFIANPYVTNEDQAAGVNTRLYRSGDWVKRRNDGHLIFMGRTDNQVKLRGFRIELSEIESALQSQESVQNAIVLLHTEEGQEELVAFVQPNLDSDIELFVLRDSLESRLPSYMIPAKWAIVKEFPLTVNGKIDKMKLPEPILIGNEKIVQALTTGENTLLKIAKQVLQIEEIGVESDLLEAGMTSLQVMEFVMEITKKGYEQITISSVYKERTIRKLLSDKSEKLYFWANPYDAKKPVIVLFCGYPYFSPFYDEFIRIFGKDFSIFAFESHHEFFLYKQNVSLDVLFESYDSVLQRELRGKAVFAFTGYCMGSELAIAFANYLTQKHPEIILPRIINMEGFFERIKSESDPYSEDKLVREHRRITQKLTEDMPSLDFKGKIMSFFAASFSNRVYLEDGEETDLEFLQKAKILTQANQQAWKRHFPSAPFYLLDCNHWTFMQEDILKIVRKAVKEHWGV